MPETIDASEAVADEPQTTHMADADVARQTAQSRVMTVDAAEAAHVEQPDRNSAMFNSMKDKLESLLKESRQPATNDKPSTTPDLKDPPTAEKIDKTKPPEQQTTTTTTKTDDKAADDTKTFTSKTAQNWKKLEEKVKEREARVAEWEAKYAAKEKEASEIAQRLKLEDRTPALQKEIEEWKAKHTQTVEQLEKVALERSERWNSQFTEPINDAIATAKNAVGADKAELVEQLLAVAPSKWRNQQLNAIRDTLEGFDQGQLDVAVANMDKIRAKRDAQLKDHKLSFQRLQGVEAEHANRQAQLSKEMTEQTVAKVLAMARNYDSFKPGDGSDPQQALLAKTNEERVAKFFRMELPLEEVATMPIIAAEGKRIIEQVLPALQKENAELREALKAREVAKPAPAGGKKTGDAERPKSFAEVFAENWQGPSR